MPKDISNNVVAVLLVLVVVVAAFGTWAFLTSFENIESTGTGTTQGQVNLNIGEQPSAPPTGTAAGNVALRIETAEG